MGLKKLKSLASGYDADHWDIYSLSIDKSGGLQVVLGLWKDKAAKQAGSDPIHSLGMNWAKDDHALNLGAIKTAIINLIKAKPDFSDAIDE